jgi:hypothetical protein
VTVLLVIGLAGIGSSSDDDAPPPLTTTDSTTTSASSGETTTTQEAAPATAPAPRARLVLTAVRGGSYLQVRNGSAGGKLLWEGTLEQGQTQRFVKYRRLWIDLGDPQNLNAKLNGLRVDLPAQPAVVLVNANRIRTISTGG